jgi:pimeloyl-ACP methyl ester carboxylesterase
MSVAVPIVSGVAGLGVAVLAGFALATRAATRRAEAAVPPDGAFVSVEGARLHYVDRGSGPAILLVHGLSGQLRNFTYALTERLDADFRVIAVDRPGAGYSVPTTSVQPDLAGQAAILARFIAALGLERPLLVGHSLGGALALRIALDHPGSIGGVALLSPLTQRQDELPAAFAKLDIPNATVRKLVAHTVAVPAGLRNAAATQALIFAPEPAPADFSTRGGGLLSLRPGAIFASSSEVSAGSGEVALQAERYATIGVPVAILFGADDRILDPARHGAATAAMIPGGRYDAIPGGHMFPLTAPEPTAAWIRDRAQELHMQE